MNWLDLLLERIVNSELLIWPAHHWLHLHLRIHVHICYSSSLHHLLLVILNKSRSHHIDSVLSLDLVTIVQQKGLKTGQLFLNWLHWHLIDCLSNLESVHGRQQLLGNVEDVLRKEGPLALRIYKRRFSVLLLLLNHDIVSLHQHQSFVQLFDVGVNRTSAAILTMKTDLFLEGRIPMEKLRRLRL